MTARDRERWRRLRKLAFQIDLGTAPGMAHFRALLRFRGPGERMGLSDVGRLKDMNFVLSAIRERASFRRYEIAPRRLVTLVPDLRDLGDSVRDRRLIEAVELVGGVLLAMAATVVRLSPFGTRVLAPLEELDGAENWPRLRALVSAAADQPVDRLAGTGPLLRACAAAEGFHAVIVSYYLEPDQVRSLPRGMGSTLFLVEPGPDPLRLGRPGLGDPVLTGLPFGLGPRLEERYKDLAQTCRACRIPIHRLRAGQPLLDELERIAAGDRTVVEKL